MDSEYESAKTLSRVRRHVRANAEKGRPHGKNIYGYLRVYDSETLRLVEVVEHPEHGPVVREAAARVFAGETFYAIARDFNARGVPTRRPTFTERRRVLGWTPVAIKQMLKMPAYAGLRQHQGQVLEDVQAVWPPLIEPDEWTKLQSIMAGRSAQKTNNWPATHMLGGIALCGVCGAGTRIGKQNAGKQRYDPETGEKLSRAYYNTYLCHGAPRKSVDGQGFHLPADLLQVHTSVVPQERSAVRGPRSRTASDPRLQPAIAKAEPAACAWTGRDRTRSPCRAEQNPRDPKVA